MDDDGRRPSDAAHNQSDPTALTTAALAREIASLKEIVFTRLDAMDQAVKLTKADLVRVPTDTDKQVSYLKELVFAKLETIDQKLQGVDKQFQERDSRVEQTARDSKLAIDAALQAAEKAVSKSELSTLKQIDGQAELIRATSKNSDDKVLELRERVTRIESVAVGGRINVTETQASSSDARGTIALYISAGLAILGVVSFILAQGRG